MRSSLPGLQFRMQLCGRACRHWTLACLACYSARLLRRQTRCSSGRSIPSRRSVCLRCCCPPGAAATREINRNVVCLFHREYLAASIPQSCEQLCRTPRAAPSLSLQVAIGRKGRFRKGAAPATKGTVLRRRRLFEQRASTRNSDGRRNGGSETDR